MSPIRNPFEALGDPTRRAILSRLARGETTVTEPNLADPSKPKSYKISYTYTVLARQQFKVAENVYDTYRIAYEVIASPTQRTTQTIHFTPNIGEVRTKEGLLLLGKNF